MKAGIVTLMLNYILMFATCSVKKVHQPLVTDVVIVR